MREFHCNTTIAVDLGNKFVKIKNSETVIVLSMQYLILTVIINWEHICKR